MGLKDAVRVGAVRGLTVQQIVSRNRSSRAVAVTVHGGNITGRWSPDRRRYPRRRPARVCAGAGAGAGARSREGGMMGREGAAGKPRRAARVSG